MTVWEADEDDDEVDFLTGAGFFGVEDVEVVVTRGLEEVEVVVTRGVEVVVGRGAEEVTMRGAGGGSGGVSATDLELEEAGLES